MPTDDELAGLLRELRGAAWTRHVRRSDPRYGDLVRRLSASAQSLDEAIEQLSELPADVPERVHHAETLVIACELEATMPSMTVEDELGRVLDATGLSGRNREVVARRLGSD